MFVDDENLESHLPCHPTFRDAVFYFLHQPAKERRSWHSFNPTRSVGTTNTQEKGKDEAEATMNLIEIE
jgi:hypothetical protein